MVLPAEHLRIIDQETFDAVQARLKERAIVYLRQAGGRFLGRAEMARDATYLFSGFLKCGTCGKAIAVRKKTFNPPRSYYCCGFAAKRGDSVCQNAVSIPVQDLDKALLDAIESTVLSPEGLSFALKEAAKAVRESLDQDQSQMENLRQRRADTQRKITRLVEAVAEGDAPKAILQQIKVMEADLAHLDDEIAGLEARGRLVNVNIEEKIRALEPGLLAWRAMLEGNALRARQVLRKLVTKPIVIEALPDSQGFRWHGELSCGAVIEGAQKTLGRPGWSGPGLSF